MGRFDAPEGWLQRNLNTEPHVAETIAMASGFGDTHGNYVNDTFSRTGAGASCLPCHDGRQFVTLAAGGPMTAGPVWAPLGCTGCHVQNGAAFDPAILRDRTKAFADRVVETVEAEMLLAYNGGDYSADFNAGLKTALDNIFEDVDNAAQIRERLITYMKGRVSYFPNKAIAQAVASWKVFYYEDSGAWAHNSKFARQVLYDAIDELGGNVADLTRPTP